VAEGQSVFEIEAGKATMEIPSPVGGTISALHVAQGDTAAVGQLVLEIAESGNAETQKTVAEEKAPEPAPAPEPEPVVEEAPASAPEPVVEEKVSEPVQEELIPDPRPLTPEPKVTKSLSVSAAPSVRRLARELGVDVHRVPSTGPAGYITAEDVKAFAKGTLEGAPATGETRIEKMSSIRKATMKHMSHCWATIPHVTQHDMADITKLEELRKRFAPKAEAAGTKLTMTAILIKVISSALKVHPEFNCSIDSEKGEIIFKDFYNIGIAMDTPRGLLVPVIRDGDKKNMVELAQELGALAGKARDGKITAADLKGGTFTFTNLGGIGGTFFTPIVNSPEVAILGCGRAVWEPGLEDGQKHFRLPLSLSYDHRIIDGADGARFLKWIVEAMEEPLLLALEG
jgi:pyruvate dehydrogenase E2 component (dihydrolipoamide acetyltransferase)